MAARRTPIGATRGTVYQAVARLRIEDARFLLEHRRFNGAIYLAGYAVECQLKFAYCRRRGVLTLPAKLETHDWDRLLHAAGLLPDVKKQPVVEAIYSALAEQWGPALRYQTGTYSPGEGNRLYKEMKELYEFLNELVP